MNNKRCIFWHRKDLRIEDNIGLNNCAKISTNLTGLYIFEPNILKYISSAQLWFIIESLKELKSNWQSIGSDLLLLKGDPIQELPCLCNAIKAELIFWNKCIEPSLIERDQKLKNILNRNAIKVNEYWDHLLIEPGRIKTIQNSNFKVYTPFMRKWKSNFDSHNYEEIITVSKPKNLKRLDKKELNNNTYQFRSRLHLLNNLPDLQSLGFEFKGSSICPCRPGENSAREQLSLFCDESLDKAKIKNLNSIFNYGRYRDIPSFKGTSYLSAALALGTLSPRIAWNQSYRASLMALNDKDTNAIKSIRIWQNELIWREFYNNAIYNFPELEKGPFRRKWDNFPWENNPLFLKSWKEGLTGVPIIDAAIRELNSTGWMHNRCRMIVASFLVKDLICNWKLGEKVFMSKLVDGDLAANNGGWQWSASSGMDAKPLRIFNPYTQAKKFDPEGIYIRYWVPELKKVNTKDLLNGEISPLERRGYPEPIVDHKEQQAYFKKIYNYYVRRNASKSNT